jgi:hypothetical protein
MVKFFALIHINNDTGDYCHIADIQPYTFDTTSDFIWEGLPEEIEESAQKDYTRYVFDLEQEVFLENPNYSDQKASLIREERNTLLKNTDWTQLSDNNLTAEQQIQWNTYRSELKNITNQESFPFDVVWPQKPDEVAE